MEQTAQFITKDMTVGDIIENYPDTAEIMMAHGLYCFGCSVNTSESLEMGAKSHDIPEQEINLMINEINEHISKKASSPQVESEEHELHLEITQLAAEKINHLAEQEGKKGYGLRIGVVRGGCSGYMYNMEFEKIRSDDDIILDQHGVRLFVDRESAKMLHGVSIDYTESLQGAGFKISNPHEKASCGCGKSFK